MRGEFASTYAKATTLIKQLKQSNDTLNRNIGVEPAAQTQQCITQEQSQIQLALQQIEQLINTMEQTYLDPDTARKIGAAKQQFRIQKDRRARLVQSVSQSEEMTVVNKPYQGIDGRSEFDPRHK